MPLSEIDALIQAALVQPGARQRHECIKFECAGCVAEGHDKHQDNASLFTKTGRWGCAVATGDQEASKRHRQAIGRALRAAMPDNANGYAVDDVEQIDAELIDVEQEAPRAPATETPYTFAPAFPAGHFVSDYIAYAASRTDAAWEYHELAALTLIAAATPNVRARLAQYPRGLGTNLYGLVIGDSTRSRKSTAKDLAKDIHETAVANGIIADQFSPESFIEQLAKRSGDSATWYVDEFGDMLDRLHHQKYMAGMRGLLLTVYGGDSYRYSRHSKRLKSGGREEDEDHIRDPHLSVLGAATPMIFEGLTSQDVLSGLLPRFAVVMPERKPPRRGIDEEAPETEGQRAAITQRLLGIYVWASSAARRVAFGPGVLRRIDVFAAEVETACERIDEAAKVMLQRLVPRVVKVSVLSAAGRAGATDGDVLTVTAADAESAIAVGQRWRADAVAFAARVGESSLEKLIRKCVKLLAGRPRIARRTVARALHIEKRTLDRVQETLVDREIITMTTARQKGRRDLLLWENLSHQPSQPSQPSQQSQQSQQSPATDGRKNAR
jgi:hypothetical protein